jgi:EmrB/QacA subfamily drug resistance transporter
MATTATRPAATPPALSPRARTAVLGATLLGLFLSSLDQTIVGTALPRIVTDLHGDSLYTWVVTAYLLTSTITGPVYGRLSDAYGRKPLLMIGIALFLVGSALSGLSQDMVQLIGFRALQGLGAGALFPISLAIIGDLFSPRERGRYQGLFGAVFGISFIAGPFLGGFLTDHVSWHWVFYVNLPIGIAALAVIATVLPTARRGGQSARDVDYLGIAVFSAGVVPVLVGLTNKGTADASGALPGWLSPQVGGPLLAGAVLLAAFLLVEARAREPIVPLDLFRDRSYSASQAAVFLIAVAMFVGVIFLPRYYQAVRGVSATQSGYEIWPLLVGLIGGSMAAGMLISRTGRYRALLTGSGVVLVAGALLMTRLESGTSTPALWSWMLVLGLGIGPSLSGFTVVVQSAAPRHRIGVATSTLTFFRQVGGSVGLAVAGSMFGSDFGTRLPGALQADGVPASAIQHLRGSEGNLTAVGDIGRQIAASLPPSQAGLVPRIVAGVHEAFAGAVGQVFWLCLAASALALVALALLPEAPLRSGRHGEELPAEEHLVAVA